MEDKNIKERAEKKHPDYVIAKGGTYLSLLKITEDGIFTEWTKNLYEAVKMSGVVSACNMMLLMANGSDYLDDCFIVPAEACD